MTSYARKVDGNHRVVRAAVEARGALWLDTAATTLGFDGLVVWRGRILPVEVKDGRLAPSRRRLTRNEQRIHQLLQAHGIPVRIVTGDDDTLAALFT